MSWDHTVEPVRVFGLVLREPVTLGHVALLHELGSPVITGGSCMIGDIATAAFVCAYPAEVARKKLRSRLAPMAFWLWSKLWKPGDTGDEFVAWLSSQCNMPLMWTPEGRSRAMAAPWWINRLAQALSAGISYRDAIDMPLRMLTLIVSAKLEMTGAAQFETPQETQWLRWVQEQTSRN